MGGNGSGGHNKKSILQHIKDGTYRKDRHGPRPQPGTSSNSEDAAASLPTDIKPPDWLSEEAKRYWRDWAPECIAMGTLDALSFTLFEGLCSISANIQEMNRRIDKEGLVVDGKPHPLLRPLYQSNEQLLELLRDFGLTPQSRARMGLADKKAPLSNDPMAKYLRRSRRN